MGDKVADNHDEYRRRVWEQSLKLRRLTVYLLRRFRLSRELDPEDIITAVVKKFLGKADDYHVKYADDEHLLGAMTKAVGKRVLDEHRRARVRRFIRNCKHEGLETFADELEVDVDSEFDLVCLSECMGVLDEKDQQVFDLRIREGLTHVEVAERLQLPEANVKARYRSMVGKLKTCCEKCVRRLGGIPDS